MQRPGLTVATPCRRRSQQWRRPGSFAEVAFAEVAFAEVAWLSQSDATQLVGAIGQLEAKVARWVPGPDFGRLAYRIASGLVRAPVHDLVGVGKELALDSAAELLALADVLHAEGRFETGFALEGIAGRLIEALIATEAPGAGPAGAAPAAAPRQRGGD